MSTPNAIALDEEEDTTCPLCMEEMDIIDKNFVPCPCGYRVCMWCWHHIKENMNGLCPACRLPYKDDPHAFAAVDSTEVIKKNKERKQKEKQDRKIVESKQQQPAPSKGPVIDRKHLHNYRVVQRNLVYMIGIPASIASEEILRKPEYFGQYGKISKVVVHRNHTSTHPTMSAYITFAYKEDAKAAIQALEGFCLEGHQIRASFGTTKYCNNFIRGVPCNNPECVYLHELGEDEDRFTKEEIQQAGYSKLMQQPGVITGGGGPSGTGKRPTVESILPPPVFVQDPALAARKASLSSQSGSPKLGGSASSDNIAGQEDASLSLDERGSEAQNDSKVSVSESKASRVADSKAGDSFESQEKKTAEDKSMVASAAAQRSEEKAVTNDNQSKQTKKESTTNQQSPTSNPLNLVSSASFNGIGNCAVFPVPVSSLTVSIWSNLLKSTSDDLKINPFALIALPVTELFELTIPPVDAACMSIWPKPMSYYCQGVGANGITHAPAGQHVYYRSNGFQENTTPESSQTQPTAVATAQSQPSNPQLQQPQSQHLQPSSSTQRPSSGSSPARFYPPQPPSQSQQSQQPQPLATLQQMFPSVNMTYGSSSSHPTSSSSQRGMFSNEPTLR